MRKSHIILGILLILVISAIFLAFLSDFSSSNIDQFSNDTIHDVTLNVSSEGPIELPKIVEDIKTADYYKGYDNETVLWMESLGNKYVFSSEDAFVIMDKNDADKIPSIYACDVSLYEIFSCDVLESHSLGNVEYPREVLYVKNVEYLREEAVYFDV